LGRQDIDTAAARFLRFAPLVCLLFPETQRLNGQIESELIGTPAMQKALGLSEKRGQLFVKADHSLPIAGSIKARGGVHEVLEYAETVAKQHGLLQDGDYRALAGPTAKKIFAEHRVVVGSTGNLGLSIGMIASALGFRAVVHMSSDAKAWKKERLRRNGVTVVEHVGDYAKAVAAGREAAATEQRSHFVDDEHSPSLLLGYSVAALHLAKQLSDAGRRVDREHPLFVYLPCGVGGAPAGIAFGLEQVYGRHAHCVFAEPTQAPCFLIEMLAATGRAPASWGVHPSIYHLGLTNRTEADGLAVPRASELAAATVRDYVSGVYTVEDETLFRHLYLAQHTQGLRIEPSAAAGFSGPQMLSETDAGQSYLDHQGLRDHMSRSTHVVWTTGGVFVPEDEYAIFLSRGADETQSAQPFSANVGSKPPM
jgi:D-serine dehydratase